MELIRRMEPLWLLIPIIGGLNWAMVGLFDANVLADVFGGTATDVVYAIVGFAALMLVPALMDRMNVDTHPVHPRGT